MPDAPYHKSRPHPVEAARRQTPADAAIPRPIARVRYAELSVTSNFTFLTCASHPDELVTQAAALGHHAVALTDTHTLAGIVRAHVAAKAAGIPPLVGARVELLHDLQNPTPHLPPTTLLLYASDLASYGRLCRLLTLGKRRAPKGQCHLTPHDLLGLNAGLHAVAVPPSDDQPITDDTVAALRGLASLFDDDRISLAISRPFGPDDAACLRRIQALADHLHVPTVAVNHALYHHPDRRRLHDVVTCIRLGCTVDQAGLSLQPHAERHLKPPEQMAQMFAMYPHAIARTVEIADRLSGFSLDQVKYRYPHEVCPADRTPMQHLTDLTRHGARERFGDTMPAKVAAQIEHELRLIDELDYAAYFLTVHDLVRFARSRGIVCQGRGAAANSAVCYLLGVTAVDPTRVDMLFERFISKQRNEPPDIDIDFEHERREEVIQYIYGKYGRERAALCAEVITYRGRLAVREVGKALGLGLDTVDHLARQIDWYDAKGVGPDKLREAALDPRDPTLVHLVQLVGDIIGFPRHLSQHVGGFVITQGPLCELVPIENAAMPDRTVIEWDKDDIEAVGMLKVDCLGLGMLTCLSKAFGLLGEFYSKQRHEGTKARRHEGGEGQARWRHAGARGIHCSTGDMSNDDHPYVSRSGGVAEEHGPGAQHLSGDPCDADGGALRPDAADPAGGGVRAFQHRGRLRSAEHGQLHPISTDSPGVAGGSRHAIRTSNDDGGHADTGPDVARSDPGGESRPPRSDPQSGIVPAPLPPPCLRASVPSCLLEIPPEDPAVYDMICEADTVGVFQIESRAQMSMLPRLRPRCYYDLVIEVAIVRPGPIVGDMVHPYLRRRNGEERFTYPSEVVERILGKTLGVPLFQEQAMSLAIHCAGFTAGEADQLRRAIAAWKSKQKVIYAYGRKIVAGMVANGYDAAFAERCFEQLKGFSEYGFPESHAASFALIVYSSAWLKCHHPAAFAGALLNAQPMGFYAPAQIIQDAQRHGVAVRPIDVNHSRWDCTLEPDDRGRPALRLGMRQVKGLRRAEAQRVADAVARAGPFDSVAGLARASGVAVASLRRLAHADAFGSMGLDRRHALWAIAALRDERLPLFDGAAGGESPVALPAVGPAQAVVHDYQHTGLSLKAHPMSFLRDALAARGVTACGALRDALQWPHGREATVAGVVLVRQRPGSASGVVFMTIEDETGVANLIFWPRVYDRLRRVVRHAAVLEVEGQVQRDGQDGKVVHVLVRRARDLTHATQGQPAGSRDFH